MRIRVVYLAIKLLIATVLWQCASAADSPHGETSDKNSSASAEQKNRNDVEKHKITKEESTLPKLVLPPRNPSNTCRTDDECALVPDRPCTCGPCQDTWREALNKKAIEELQSRWAKRRCRMPECQECAFPGRFIGKKAVCINQQCVPRE